MKIVTVGNAQRHYSLFCNVTAAGCITPERGKNYLLFDGKTRWKMPGAKDFIDLAFVQDWTVKYNQGENIGLIPEKDPAQTNLACSFSTGQVAATNKTPLRPMVRSFTAPE